MQPALLATLLLLPLLAVTSASDAAGEAYLTANKAKPGVVALPSGLQYEVLRKGKGFKKVEVRVLITRRCIIRWRTPPPHRRCWPILSTPLAEGPATPCVPYMYTVCRALY